MDVTDVMHSCRCCLRCPPDKEVATPYIHLGKAEVYADMLKDCFDLELTLTGLGSCGICSACVNRLRDASEFKLQVQRCQVELQELLVKAEPLEIVIKSELGDTLKDDSAVHVSYEVPIERTRDIEETGGVSDNDPLMMCETTYNLKGGNSIDTDEVTIERTRDIEETGGVSEKDPLMMCETTYNLTGGNSIETDCDTPATGQAEAARIASDSCRIGRRLYTLRPQETPTHKNTSKTYFQCHDCGRNFTKRTLLTKHIHKTHTGNTHKCTYCHFNYKHKSALKEHEMTHTGEKPFQCTYCDYKTRHNSNLKTHIMIHTGEKPLSCNMCKYKCRRDTELSRHKRTHTKEKPYSCNQCNFTSSDKTHLRSHEMAHTGEKPFKCEFCDYKCRRKSDIKVHQQIHTGEKPIQCNLCEYSCRHRNSLRLHLKAKHPNDIA